MNKAVRLGSELVVGSSTKAFGSEHADEFKKTNKQKCLSELETPLKMLE